MTVLRTKLVTEFSMSFQVKENNVDQDIVIDAMKITAFEKINDGHTRIYTTGGDCFIVGEPMEDLVKRASA